jgi:hypothetical protein
MAYSDLYADAQLYMGLDNNYNYSTTGTLESTVGTGTPVFANDAPTNTGSAYSLKLNGYASALPRHTFKNFATNPSDTGRSVSFWFKYTKAAGGTFAYGESLGSSSSPIIFQNDPTTGINDNDTLTMLLGGTKSTNGGTSEGKINFSGRYVTIGSVATGYSAVPAAQKIDDNIWYHIAFVQREVPGSNSIETAIYVNGACWLYQITSGATGFEHFWGRSTATGQGFRIFASTSSSDTIANKYLAHYAVFAKALTPAEIRAQAWYGLSGGNYVDLVNSDSPLYFTTLENEDKATDPTVYGATSWGPLNDSRSGVTVNQLGYPTGKSWKILDTGTGAQNFADTSNANFVDGLNTAIRSGEYSYEFWFKINGKPSATKTIIEYNGGTAGAGQQTFTIRNNGTIEFRSSYKNGSSTYISGSVTVSTSNIGILNSVTFPGDTSSSLNLFADNEWHHLVYTQSNSQGFGGAGTYAGEVYIDGWRISSRNWTSTFGWLDLQEIIGSSYFTFSANQTAFADMHFDNLAIYSRRLSNQEIQEHFIAGKTYVAPSARVVKHWTGGAWVDSIDQKVWNGTAWVNWDAKYWNGTAWIDL